MKLVHHQTQFAQVDVKVDHHVSRHGWGEHLLLEESSFQFNSIQQFLSVTINIVSRQSSQKPRASNNGRTNALFNREKP